MAKIINLTIKNFRGIKDLSIDFGDENLVCFVGRGDSGKTTILEAVSSVLSSSWNLTFHDTDFYNCDFESSIEIEATLVGIPDKLLSDEKYGLHIKSLNVETREISDELIPYGAENVVPILTIKLVVDKSLEPTWTVTNSRKLEDKQISAADRSMLNCSMISDYIDRHFSWNKGNPLFSLLKEQGADKTKNQSSVVIDSLRQAKSQIDEFHFKELEEVTSLVKNQAALFGLNISEAHTTLDFKELSIKDGRISLHENAIPFRLKGKGSKRLASFAIQTALGKNGGIILVDEIEQGLEPDRVKQLVRTLKNQNTSQIFLTTHSREVITELDADNLDLVLKEYKGDKIEVRKLVADNERLQKAVRACAEAFFAKKVIVCEGATEIGICRAMDKWRISQNQEQMSFKDCAYVDGTGSTLVERSQEIQKAGINAALFCDSDDSSVNMEKNSLKSAGVDIFDCESDKCIEQQIFSDMPWAGVKEILTYVQKHFAASFSTAFADKITAPIDELQESDDLRNEIVSAFKTKQNGSAGKKWFKAIHHGEYLGDIAFKYLHEMDVDCHLRKSLTALSGWINK